MSLILNKVFKVFPFGETDRTDRTLGNTAAAKNDALVWLNHDRLAAGFVEAIYLLGTKSKTHLAASAPLRINRRVPFDFIAIHQ